MKTIFKVLTLMTLSTTAPMAMDVFEAQDDELTSMLRRVEKMKADAIAFGEALDAEAAAKEGMVYVTHDDVPEASAANALADAQQPYQLGDYLVKPALRSVGLL